MGPRIKEVHGKKIDSKVQYRERYEEWEVKSEREA